MGYSKKTLSVIGIILFSIISCNSKRISGSGTIIRESRSVSGFQRVSLSGAGHLFINQGDEESLEIECDDNILSYIKTRVNGGTLEIGPEKVSLDPSKPITYRLSLKNLQALTTISGSGDAGVWATAKLDVTISGSGTLSYYGSPAVSSSISGSGKVKSLGSK